MTPRTAAHQASLSITNSQSPPKLMSVESVMQSNHLIISRPLLPLPSIFPSIRIFSNESALASGGLSIGVSASTSVLPMNTQDWSPLGWTGWILQSKGLSRVVSNTTVSVVNQETGHSGFSKVIFLNTDQLKLSKLMCKEKKKRIFKVYVVIPNFLTYINWSFTRREKRELISTATRKNRKVTLSEEMAKNVQNLMKDIDLYQLNILANTKQNNSKNSHLVMSQWNCWST